MFYAPVRGRLCRALVAASAIGCFGLTSALQAQQGGALSKYETQLQQKMHLRGASVVKLNVPLELNKAMQVRVPFDGRMVTLDLSPFSVWSPEFALWEHRADGFHQVDPGPVNTLRGSVVEAPESVVAGGLMADGLYARIVLADGRDVWLEPLARHIPGSEAGLYVMYTSANAIQGHDECGNTEMPDFVDHKTTEGGVAPRGVTLYTAQLATDADFEYLQAWGGTTWVNQRIGIVINTMNVQYEREVNITHVITQSVVRTAEPDPYSTTDPATLNAQIQAEWNGAAGTRDVIQLFTGRDIAGSVIGRANAIGSICSAGNGASNCYVQSDFNGNFMSSTDLSAHELGHLWDAVHCTCSSPASTMNPFITSINRFILSNNQDNVGQIVAYRNSRACLTTSATGAAPANDACSDAVVLGPGRFGFSNVGATDAGPAPTTCGTGNQIGADVWFTYTAPCDGTLTVSTCEGTGESGFDTVILAYTGGCGALVQVGCNDDSTCSASGLRSSLSFDVTRNTTYRIRVGGYQAATGNGILNVDLSNSNCPPAPSNDTCANAITISECDGTVAVSNVGAATDGFVDPTNCTAAGSAQVFNDVWYRVVAPCTGTLRASTCGSAIDTRIAIYTSCPTGVNQALACNDDNGPGCTGLDASVDFTAIAGADYYIRIGSYNPATTGNMTLAINNLACPIPANDSCLSPITVGVGLNNINNVNACANTPSGCGSGQRAVYYAFTAPSTCAYTIDTCGLATWDTVLAVYASCFSTSPIACSDDNCGATLQSSLTFNATEGVTYLVRLAGFGGAQGTGQMRITAVPPANDTCAGAAVIGLGTTAVDNRCANGEGSNGCLSGLASVFYSFTSPVDCTLNIDTCSDPNFDTVIAVYANCAATTPIACDDDTCGVQSRVSINATAGTTYIIRVAGFGGASGTATLRVGATNDECADARVVGLGVTPVSIAGATQSGPNIGCLIPFADVWFRFDATVAGDLTVDTCSLNTNFDTVLSAYFGANCPVGGGRQAACNDDACSGTRSRITFGVFPGESYLIRLSNFSNVACGNADLNLTLVPYNCACDFNHDGRLNSQDFFDFLGAFFPGQATADFNHDGRINSQDFFDFLGCFFAPPAGCH